MGWTFDGVVPSEALAKRLYISLDFCYTFVLKIYQSMSVLFHESERKAKAGKGYFENVSTQVDIENAGGPIMRTRPDTRP